MTELPNFFHIQNISELPGRSIARHQIEILSVVRAAERRISVTNRPVGKKSTAVYGGGQVFRNESLQYR